MTTVADSAPIAEPVVRRKLRRRPPPSIRNGRALLLGVAGYGITGLFTVGLGVIIGVKGALGLFLPFALVTVPLAAVLYGITRLTRNRQIWSWAIAVGAGLLLSVISIYLIVTMQSRTSDANAIFFLQLLISPVLVFAVASAWHFARGRAWFNGERERQLRPEESGARPITAPLIGGGPSAAATTFVSTGPALAEYAPRLGAYLIDLVLVAILTAIPIVLGFGLQAALGGGIGSLAAIAGIAVGILVNLGYFAYFWSHGGVTPGMRPVHLQVVHEVGDQPLTWGNAIRRYIVFVFAQAALYIGFLWVFVDPRRKAWQDIAARTLVVDSVLEAKNRKSDAEAEMAEAKAKVAAGADPLAVATSMAEIDDPMAAASEPIVAGIVAAEAAMPAHVVADRPLLTVQGLKKHFPIYGGVMRRQIGTVYAVDGVDFEIMPGETFSLVGESGCGKTTLGRTVIQLTPSTDGRVVFDGYELADVDPDDMRPLRRRMQIIFQDPFGSLNPRMPVSDIIGEGLLAQGLNDRAARDKRVEDSLELVGLRREYSRRYPHEFSGGQRQRIGVARALALGPDFIVADEPVSALDVSIQSQVLNLLLDLKRELNLTYLFISHNLQVVQYFSDRVGVMYLGKIAEVGSVDQLYHDPRHPYTVALLSAIPDANPRRRKSRVVLKGDVPSPAAPPSGCRFHTRCWLRERLGNPENCSTIEPQLRPFGQEGHQVACHWAEDLSAATVSQAAAETPAIVAAVADDE
jgi:oligopeptide/dipeptide ABC transporter ATP-binding protein